MSMIPSRVKFLHESIGPLNRVLVAVATPSSISRENRAVMNVALAVLHSVLGVLLLPSYGFMLLLPRIWIPAVPDVIDRTVLLIEKSSFKWILKGPTTKKVDTIDPVIKQIDSSGSVSVLSEKAKPIVEQSAGVSYATNENPVIAKNIEKASTQNYSTETTRIIKVPERIVEKHIYVPYEPKENTHYVNYPEIKKTRTESTVKAPSHVANNSFFILSPSAPSSSEPKQEPFFSREPERAPPVAVKRYSEPSSSEREIPKRFHPSEGDRRPVGNRSSDSTENTDSVDASENPKKPFRPSEGNRRPIGQRRERKTENN